MQYVDYKTWAHIVNRFSCDVIIQVRKYNVIKDIPNIKINE